MTAADLHKLTMADFAAHKDATFVLHHPQLPPGVPLQLTNVQRLGESGRAGGAFSLTFVSTGGPLLPQMIYPLSHPQMGRLEIFLVPVGQRDGGFIYESIFT